MDINLINEIKSKANELRGRLNQTNPIDWNRVQIYDKPNGCTIIKARAYTYVIYLAMILLSINYERDNIALINSSNEFVPDAIQHYWYYEFVRAAITMLTPNEFAFFLNDWCEPQRLSIYFNDLITDTVDHIELRMLLVRWFQDTMGTTIVKRL